MEEPCSLSPRILGLQAGESSRTGNDPAAYPLTRTNRGLSTRPTSHRRRYHVGSAADTDKIKTRVRRCRRSKECPLNNAFRPATDRKRTGKRNGPLEPDMSPRLSSSEPGLSRA